MVARHGERTPSAYYDLLVGREFPEPEGEKELTEVGAKSMFKLGQSLRQFALKADWMKVYGGCLPEELYVPTSFKERSVSTMTSFLNGLCGEKF